MTRAGEAAFTRAVIGRANSAGLLAHWCPDSRRCAGNPGFPDVLIAGPRGLLLAELKLAGAGTSAEQDLWAWTISEASDARAAGGRPLGYELWGPADLQVGIVDRALEQLA